MELLSLKWWSDLVPLWSATTLRAFFIVFLSLMVIGAVIRMVSRKRIKDRLQLETVRRIATLFVVMGLLGVWYWFVSVQQVPFLSARFWLILWVLGVIWWIWSILRFTRKKVPAMREEAEARSAGGDKYLQPNPKQKTKKREH